MTRLPSKMAPATTRTTTSKLKGKSDRAEPKSEGDAAIQSADSDTSVNPRVGVIRSLHDAVVVRQHQPVVRGADHL